MEVNSTAHLTKESRDNYDKENEYNFTQEDYELDILELKKVLMYLTATSVNGTQVIMDKYSKDNLENNRQSCFTKEELNWSKSNIDYFYSSQSLHPMIK